MKSHAAGALEVEFERIRREHRDALRKRIVRATLGGSVIRVFAQGTKPGLARVLEQVPVDDLPGLDQKRFEEWFEVQLERVARELRKRNHKNPRLQPGLKRGHAVKVLSLYLRDLVAHTRYFDDRAARRIERWLHVPVDRIVIGRLRCLGVRFEFRGIREISSRAKFLQVQECLEEAAVRIGVPRVWFDDNWADRQD